MTSEDANIQPSPNGRFGSRMSRRVAEHRAFDKLRGEGLRARAMRGSGWTLMGFGAQQVLRLGSTLILTRLLFPEAFGLMALAQVFLQGLTMLSDIGVGPSIIQNKRGDDPDFLATAWTMQVIRGFALFLGMCALAYPASLIYDEPLLFPILLLIGTTAMLSGFQSIGIATASRKMALGRLTMIDLVSQVCGITTMVVWAWLHPTVWALVAGGIIGAMVRVALGHFVLGSAGNKLHFERSAAHEIFHFGKWIFFATALTYFGGQGLRLIQGSLVSMSMLGMIAIAASIATLGGTVINKVIGSVLFPAFAEIHRKEPDQFVRKVRDMRFKVLLATSPFFLMSIMLGQPIIALLYDERYEQAGVFVVVLSVSTAVQMLRVFFAQTMFVKGDSYGHAFVMFFSSVLQILGVVLGYFAGGVVGMLWGGVIAEAIIYPISIYRVRRHKVWVPSIDVILFILYISLGALMTIHLTS